MPTSASHLWNRVNITDNPEECWDWLGSLSDSGYGKLSFDGRNRRAHHVAWEQANGPMPKGGTLRRRCENKVCCNPDHLILYVAEFEPGKGAPPGEGNGNSRLTPAIIRDIRNLVSSGYTQASAARKYAITSTHVSAIVRRISWKHIL